jgi:hypothetical protein
MVGRGVASPGYDVLTSPNICYTAAVGNRFLNSAATKGWAGRWCHGSASHIAFNTVLAPNAPACGDDGNDNNTSAVLPPSSNHPGGALLCYGDASVSFITETIDTGNTGAAPVNNGPSPYGVWGAIGSMAGGEVVSKP